MVATAPSMLLNRPAAETQAGSLSAFKAWYVQEAATTIDFEIGTIIEAISSASGRQSVINGAFLPVIQSAIRFSHAREQFQMFQDMEPGWNGLDGLPATLETIKAADAFLDALPFGLPEPRAMLSPNGEIGLFWSVNGYYAEAGFQGKSSYFFSEGQGRIPVGVDNFALSDDLVYDELAGALLETFQLAA